VPRGESDKLEPHARLNSRSITTTLSSSGSTDEVTRARPMRVSPTANRATSYPRCA
jgi:hypothetical protein